MTVASDVTIVFSRWTVQAERPCVTPSARRRPPPPSPSLKISAFREFIPSHTRIGKKWNKIPVEEKNFKRTECVASSDSARLIFANSITLRRAHFLSRQVCYNCVIMARLIFDIYRFGLAKRTRDMIVSLSRKSDPHVILRRRGRTRLHFDIFHPGLVISHRPSPDISQYTPSFSRHCMEMLGRGLSSRAVCLLASYKGRDGIEIEIRRSLATTTSPLLFR